MADKWLVVLALCYAFMMFFPFLCLIAFGNSLLNKIEPSLLGGFITASGIFLALITSSIISKKEYLTKYDHLMAVANLGIFIYALDGIFVKHLALVAQLDFLDLAFILMSVNANAFLAILIAWRLLWQKLSN